MEILISTKTFFFKISRIPKTNALYDSKFTIKYCSFTVWLWRKKMRALKLYTKFNQHHRLPRE